MMAGVLARVGVTAGVRPGWRLLAVAGIALLPVLLSLPFLSEPMEQDEGVYFAVAMSADLPYSSVFDHKPPLVHAWYTLALALNGGEPSIEMVRLLAALHLSVAAVATGALGMRLLGARAGWAAGAFMAAAPANQYLQFNANSEAFVVAPLVLSLLAFTEGCRAGNARWMLVAGALAGVAAMTKSVAGLHLLALAGVLAWAAAMGLLPRRHALRHAGALVAGAACVCAIVAAPFAATGHWDDFWYANVTYNLAYSAQLPFEAKVFGLGAMNERALVGGLPLWVLALGGAVILARGQASITKATVLSGAAAAFLGASATGREYAHYWVLLVPFAALLAGAALDRLTRDWTTFRSRVHVEALLLALLMPALFALVPLFVVGPDQAHLRKYHYGVNAQRALENDDVASFVASRSTSGDRLFVFGNDAQLYALSDRRPAAYFPRAVDAIAVDDDNFGRIMRELRAAPPEIIVDSARVQVTAALLGLQSEQSTLDVAEEQREEFDAFLRQHYHRAGDAAYAEVWVLN